MFKKRWKQLGAIFAAAVMLTGTISTAAADARIASLPAERGNLTIHKYLMDDVSGLNGDDNKGTGDAADSVKVPTDAVPLDGVTFKIQQIDITLDADGNVFAPEGGKVPEKASDVTADMLVAGTEAEETTESGGIAYFPDLPRGFYLVTEQPNEKVAEPAAPFIVSVPMTNQTGDGWITDVHVYPKNESVRIDKFVTEIGNKHETSDTHGGEQTWIIQSSVPTNIASSKKYTITDALAKTEATDIEPAKNILEYVDGSVIVHGTKESSPTKDSEKKVIPGEFYLTAGTDISNIKVSFTEEGRKYLAAQGFKNVLVEFKTTLTDDAPMSTEIENGATLEYKNQYDSDFEDVPGTTTTVEEKPEIHTGRIKIIKVDINQQEKGLNGAKFKIAVSQENALAGKFIQKDGADIEVETQNIAGTDGMAEITGLNYGRMGDLVDKNTRPTVYWLVETKAPDGYNLLHAPVKLEISTEGIAEGGYIAQVTVQNSSGFTMPLTGGAGTVVFTVTGIAILVFALMLIGASLKKRNKADENK